MSFRSLLRERGTIRRRSEGTGADEHGGDTDPFTTIATDVPCRKYTTRGREVVDAGGTRRLTTTAIDFLPGTDVTAADQLVLDGRTWELLSVDDAHGHHLVASAEVWNG